MVNNGVPNVGDISMVTFTTINLVLNFVVFYHIFCRIEFSTM
jgi:hypothetical protein